MEQVQATCEPLVVTQAAADTSLFAVQLVGVLCNTSSGGTITVADKSGGSRTIVSAMPLVAGQWYVVPFKTVGQVTIAITGTATVTVGYNL